MNLKKKHYEKYKEFFFINPITICTLNDKKYIIDGYKGCEEAGFPGCCSYISNG